MARHNLEKVLRFAPSSLRVERSRPAAKGLVRERRLAFLFTVVVLGNNSY